MSSLIKLVLFALLIVFLLCVGPWLMIWAINTLIAASMAGAPATAFVPQIAFGFWTWLAAVLLGGLAAVFSSKRS